MRWTDHKTIGLQYGVSALVFLLLGFLLMLVMRWQLAWPTSPLPPLMAAAVGEHNAPSGYMLPEFYNQLVAMHGTVMIFLAVVPLLAGAYGNYIVPLQIGAREMAFPRLNAASFWLYLVAGLVSLVSFFVPMGAANSGWTSYPPLAVLATQGQDYWLVAIFLLGVSSALNAINMIATIVQLQADGISFSRMSFFVWAQLITALLLLLAFPALQAAAVLQLMDRLAGTSFFLPSGLYVAGAPLQGPTGGGNPLLWQHLFWFLGHPEVYVLVLPAIGIVAEVIVAEQFTWNIHYPGPDERFGRTSQAFIGAANPLGIDRTDPDARDDIGLLNVLMLPLGRPVVLELTSRDVTHSFTLNEMRVRQDAVPGMETRTWFTPIVRGKWDIACSQLCGVAHYRMRGEYTVLAPDEWQRWLTSELALLPVATAERGDDRR
jgi:heme/copper-type cytochrome/quinol oxidase subunit 2